MFSDIRGRAMKKILLLAAMGVMLQGSPVLAQDLLNKTEAQNHAYKKRVFDKYDTDENGVISQDEFFVNLKKRFVSKDKNKDGVLSFEEADIALPNKQEMMKKLMKDKKKEWRKKLGNKLLENTAPSE
jgi:Ca2+-binding EF-hand superfamily protein